MDKWTRVKFQPNLPLKESGRATASERAYPALQRGSQGRYGTFKK